MLRPSFTSQVQCKVDHALRVGDCFRFRTGGSPLPKLEVLSSAREGQGENSQPGEGAHDAHTLGRTAITNKLLHPHRMNEMDQ